MMAKSIPLEQRFWSKVDRSGGPGACWEWTGSRTGPGYGELRVGPTMRSAHRLSWELNRGTIPEAACVLHRCDNRNCVNPDHLSLGTRRDNNADMWNKGRGVINPPPNVGADNPAAVLSPEAVREIRRRCAAGETQASVAALFGVTRSAVAQIVQWRTWKHVG